jgi:hypothetical protein
MLHSNIEQTTRIKCSENHYPSDDAEIVGDEQVQHKRNVSCGHDGWIRPQICTKENVTTQVRTAMHLTKGDDRMYGNEAEYTV